MEEIIKKGAWDPEEDQKLKSYIMRYGIWNWNHMPKFAGLSRTGKSCRLRWMNYLHPDVKRGPFTMEEVEIVIKMYKELGNRWSAIAGRLPGRTDNEVKNFFHTHLKKNMGVEKNIVSSKGRRKRSEKTKKSEKTKLSPVLFVDIGPNNKYHPISTSSNKSTNSSMLSPDVSSSSSIITFDQNQNMNYNIVDQPKIIHEMENTVILESNPASTHEDNLMNIRSLDELDTNSFWLHLLNDAHRLIL